MTVERVHPAIYRITAPFEGGGVVYLYLLKGDRIALIDTGVANTPHQVLEPALSEIGLAPTDLDLILNSHAHMDHTGGNSAAKQASGAPIHIHPADEAVARSNDALVELMNAPFQEVGHSPASLQQRAAYILRNCGEPVPPDALLAENDVIDLGRGIQLRVFHTPGHTPGSVSYYWESEGIVLTGDAVQGYGARIGAYPSYANASDYRRSLAKLAGLDFSMLAGSHPFPGGAPTNLPTRVGPEARSLLDISIQAADTMHQVVAEAVRQMPDASRRDIALSALGELIFHIPQLLDRATRMPRTAAPSLVAHMDAVRDGSYPA